MKLKRIGNWWVPPKQKLVSGMVESDVFPCESALKQAWLNVNKFDLAVDVGTWIGDSTVAMSRQFKQVIGFEANPIVYDCCVQNLADRHITNCSIHQIGLSNTSGPQPFYNKGKSTWSGWISTKITDSEHQMVETTTLDSMNLRNVDFLKIDVDGHEGYLLQGAKQFLSVNSPVIMCEIKVRVQLERQPDHSPDAFQLLAQAGYRQVERVGKHDYIYIK